MKKFMKPFVLVAAAAMALASCQKNEFDAPQKQTVHFTVNAGIETKTSITEETNDGKTIYTPQWDGNEELGVLFAAPDKDTEAKDVVKLTNAESGPVASFKGNVTVEGTAGTFYAFYPATAFYRGYEEGDARLDLKNVQMPTATSFDPTCDILVAKPYDYVVEDGAVVADGLEFARIMSVLRIDLNSEFADVQNEFVESVSFTAGDVEITGYARIFLDNPKFDKWASNGAQWRTVTANYDSELVSINGESKSVYLVIAPVTIPANKDLTFEIKTKNYKISKTVKSPEMKFTAGNVSKINLTILPENCEKIDQSIDYSGEYLIVDTDLTKAASKWTGANNLTAIDIVSENGVVYEADNLADCKMTITKVTEGDNAGKYTIQDAAGKYLYAAGGSGSNNYLKGSDTESYWTIEEDGVKYVMTSLSGAARNILRYNATNNPPIFSCYGSGQKEVTLYKYSDLVPDTRQILEIASEPLNLTADAATGTITVKAQNVGTVTVKALAAEDSNVEVDWLTLTYNNGVISYSATANELSESRTAYIQASASDDLKAGVAVTQAAKPSADAPVEVTDVLTLSTLNVTYSSYTTWSGKTFTSNAVYAGNSFNSYNSIQLRNTSPSGIVTTQSGGKLKKIIVEWHSSTNTTRYITIYGKNSSYSSSSDLYDTNKRGESLGQIKNGTTELVISGDFTHFGILASGALYLPEIKVVWESTTSEGGDSSEPDPEPEPDPTPDPEGATNFAFTSANDVTQNGITVRVSKGSGSTAPAYYSSGLRLYAKNTIVVSSEVNITRVEYVFSKQGSKDYATASGDAIYTSGGTSSIENSPVTDVWTGSSKEITVTLGSSGQRILKSLTVYTD